MSDKKKEMKAEHKRFAELYAAGMNGTRAYMECYPNCSYDSAMCNAYRLLKREDVHEYVVIKQKEYYDALSITPERIAQKLAEMAFADKTDGVYGPSVALKALDMLQKQFGLQKQQVKAEVDNTTTIKVSIDEE